MSKAKPRHTEPTEENTAPDGAQVAPASKPTMEAEPGPVDEAAPPAPAPVVPGVTWPCDCTVEIPLCLLGRRKFLACESEDVALARYMGLSAGLKSKHAPIIRPLTTCTKPE